VVGGAGLAAAALLAQPLTGGEVLVAIRVEQALHAGGGGGGGG
jgi:hypothetical protein